ncbi:DUF6199 family natural product biosynthesis protein [Paenibacillus sp. L3-i20]|uniref:DUF6199 family natural product biosynthesis protein n=1 Tax=Paenibacillus sp. L3-i20 TaxID=2905833 RepID=UPI001EE097DC|nr:DUF6199 family natural product biosynthesis protein [Paenibacillus sp. L3-i20]GKU78449.1 hypothetical protein L3i20_v228460 [Paenibacillus sp. L3-i20]
MIFLSILLVVVGLIMIFKTSLFWKISEKWTSADGTEPSDLYIFNTRFGGIMVSIAGSLGIVATYI